MKNHKYEIHERAWVEVGEVEGEWVAGLFLDQDEEAPARPEVDPRIEAEHERQRELTDRLERILSKAEAGT